MRIIDQVAKALHAAHEVGLLHRDIKPSNILLDGNDFAYLIDFGIARAIEETRMTKSGNTIGTFQYIAPERLDTGTEDARADIYSLACVLYESLTGDPPFPGSSTAQLINAHLNAPPPRPSTTQPDVPPQVDDVIATGMAKDPDQRYATTVELANAAHNAITTPITRPAQSLQTPASFATIPASPLPATESAALAATQHAPDPSEPSAVDQRSRKRRRIALAGGAAVIATIVVVLAIVFTNGTTPANRPAAIPTAPPNTGPFTGVYRADFGPSATNGKPDEGGTPSTGQWSVRSACRPTGCVATATSTGWPNPSVGIRVRRHRRTVACRHRCLSNIATAGRHGLQGLSLPRRVLDDYHAATTPRRINRWRIQCMSDAGALRNRTNRHLHPNRRC